MTTRKEVLAKYADLDLVGFLCNGCYGGFGFSDLFMEKLNERQKVAGLESREEYWYDRRCPTARADPMVIRLFQELGSRASSGYHARLYLTWFPREFLEFTRIHEYDGSETVSILFKDVESELLKKFLEDWKTDSSLTVEELDRRVTVLKAKQERYREFTQELWKAKQTEKDISKKEGTPFDSDVE